MTHFLYHPQLSALLGTLYCSYQALTRCDCMPVSLVTGGVLVGHDANQCYGWHDAGLRGSGGTAGRPIQIHAIW